MELKFRYYVHKNLHWTIHWVIWIQSSSLCLVSLISVLILSFHLPVGLTSCLFPSVFPAKVLYAFSVLTRVQYACPVSLHWFDHPNATFPILSIYRIISSKIYRPLLASLIASDNVFVNCFSTSHFKRMKRGLYGEYSQLKMVWRAPGVGCEDVEWRG
jgi:hypothetical protein